MTTCTLEAGHPHGGTDHYATGCRCADTIRAHDLRLARQRRNRRRHAAGLYEPDLAIDATEVLAHLDMLTGQGYRPVRIAELTGLSRETVRGLIRDRTPKVRQSTATALLAFHGDPRATVKAGRHPAQRTMLHLRALASIGHTLNAVAAHTPLDPKDPRALTKRAAVLQPIRAGERQGVLHPVRQAVDTAYDQLWNAPPVDRTPADRANAKTIAAYAARMRWPRPMDLDDDQLDTPGYSPTRPRTRNDRPPLVPLLTGTPAHSRPATLATSPH